MALSQDLEILQAEGGLKPRSAALCLSGVIISLGYRKASAATCAERQELASDARAHIYMHKNTYLNMCAF